MNLQTLNLQELSHDEMREKQGGVLHVILGGIAMNLLVEVGTNGKAHVDAFKKGWNSDF